MSNNEIGLRDLRQSKRLEKTSLIMYPLPARAPHEETSVCHYLLYLNMHFGVMDGCPDTQKHLLEVFPSGYFHLPSLYLEDMHGHLMSVVLQGGELMAPKML